MKKSLILLIVVTIAACSVHATTCSDVIGGRLDRDQKLTSRFQELMESVEAGFWSDMTSRAQQIESHPQKSLIKLTRGERVALLTYLARSYTLNRYLYNGETSQTVPVELLHIEIELLNRALDRIPVFNGTLQRTIRLTDESIARYRPGETITEPGFVSTSEIPYWAAGNVKFIIQSKTGRDIRRVLINHEDEILFKNGTQFEVISKQFEGATQQWLIELREI
jgi:hypothetical protein